jgi:hypothetical protein
LHYVNTTFTHLELPQDTSSPSSRFDLRFSIELDRVVYHRIDENSIPSAIAETDVKIDDNGTVFDAVMLAGSGGYQVSSSGNTEVSETGKLDTIQPLSMWWIYIK